MYQKQARQSRGSNSSNRSDRGTTCTGSSDRPLGAEGPYWSPFGIGERKVEATLNQPPLNQILQGLWERSKERFRSVRDDDCNVTRGSPDAHRPRIVFTHRETTCRN